MVWSWHVGVVRWNWACWSLFLVFVLWMISTITEISALTMVAQLIVIIVLFMFTFNSLTCHHLLLLCLRSFLWLCSSSLSSLLIRSGFSFKIFMRIFILILIQLYIIYHQLILKQRRPWWCWYLIDILFIFPILLH